MKRGPKLEAKPNIRAESAEDIDAISAITTAAFQTAPHSGGNEAAIIDALRSNNALTLSLVAEIDGDVVGQVSFSPVTIGGKDVNWLGLGPIAVHPDHQTKGVGSALIYKGLGRIQRDGCVGCILLGDPNYYERFGFKNEPTITFPFADPKYLQAITFNDVVPAGEVIYHSAFKET